MANFKTHLAIAAVVSTGAAGVVAGFGTVSYSQAALLASLGMFGGILPDIDSDKSSAIAVVFNLVAFFIAFLAFLLTFWSFHVGVALATCISVFLIIRFPVRWLFERFTVHRGVFHSMLAAAMMGLLFTVATDMLLNAGHIISWYTGLFVTLGYLVHLLLDELYSVDFSNARIKKSFGSAIKPLSLKYPAGSVLFAAIVTGLYFVAPETGPFFESIMAPANHQHATVTASIISNPWCSCSV